MPRRVAQILVRAIAVLVLCIVVLPSSAQEKSPQERKVLINFLVRIDSNTINALLRTVSEQIRNGTKNITILISSSGGDTASGLAAYNILKNLPADITTFNVGNVDSAAMLLYSAGKYRYSLPGPGTRFLIHGNRVIFGVGVPLDASTVDAQLQQIKSLNQMILQVLEVVAPSKRNEIEQAIQNQTILTPEQAMDWGIVQQIKKEFLDPTAPLIAITNPTQTPTEEIKDPQHYSADESYYIVK